MSPSLQLVSDEAGGEWGRVERYLELFRKIGERTNMILMPVGEDDSGQPVALLLDELQLGQDQVVARILRIGEGEAEIDHQPLALAAVEIDVHANLARTAERAEK